MLKFNIFFFIKHFKMFRFNAICCINKILFPILSKPFIKMYLYTSYSLPSGFFFRILFIEHFHLFFPTKIRNQNDPTTNRLTLISHFRRKFEQSNFSLEFWLKCRYWQATFCVCDVLYFFFSSHNGLVVVVVLPWLKNKIPIKINVKWMFWISASHWIFQSNWKATRKKSWNFPHRKHKDWKTVDH